MSTNLSRRPPQIVEMKVENYRALKSVKFNKLTRLTAFLGPNGSGKSTLFDVFAFLSDCFGEGLRRAWDKRGRFKELRTRGVNEPIRITLKYQEEGFSPITYHLSIAERLSGPVVASEWLQWSRKGPGKPFRFLDFANGSGSVVTGQKPDKDDERTEERLSSAESLAVNTLGQFAKHERVESLRQFITGWYLSYLTTTSARGAPEAGPQERLTATGDNLANVIQYYVERQPARLRLILDTLKRRVPRLERVEARPLEDGRLLLQIKDAPFERPILARYASDGTLKMLAYLLVLHDVSPPPLIGIEEPENFLHPRLLAELAAECRQATDASQLFVTTHSPFFVNELRPNELWMLYRDERGYTQARRATDMPGVPQFVEHGGKLGHIWMEGLLGVGDPLTNAGGPARPTG